MMSVFRTRDADANWERSRKIRSKQAPDSHPTIVALKSIEIKPKHVLEIGCSSGFVLEKVRILYGCKVVGIELGKDAIKAGQKLFPSVKIYHGSWETIKKIDQKFDVIILGFFIFLVPPEKILHLLTLVLDKIKKGGCLLLYDFKSLSRTITKYKHGSLFSFKYPLQNLIGSIPGIIEVYSKSFNTSKKIWHMTQITAFKKTYPNDFLNYKNKNN